MAVWYGKLIHDTVRRFDPRQISPHQFGAQQQFWHAAVWAAKFHRRWFDHPHTYLFIRNSIVPSSYIPVSLICEQFGTRQAVLFASVGCCKSIRGSIVCRDFDTRQCSCSSLTRVGYICIRFVHGIGSLIRPSCIRGNLACGSLGTG